VNLIDALLLVIALALCGGCIAIIYGYYQGMRYVMWGGVILVLAAILLAIGLGAFDDITPEMFILIISSK